MGPAALALLAALSFGGHMRSEGRSSFSIDDTGLVEIEIEIGFLDVPELCNADLLVEPARADEMRRRLAACLTRDMPQVLRVRGDERACPVVFLRTEDKPAPGDARGGTLRIFARADCGALPRALIVDWGLFRGSSLDHVSIAKIEQPYDKPRLAMLSKRAPRFTLEIARPLWPRVAAGAGVAVLLGAGAGVLFGLRRRRKRA